MQDIILIPGSWFKKPFRKAAAIHVSLHGQVFMGPSKGSALHSEAVSSLMIRP